MTGSKNREKAMQYNVTINKSVSPDTKTENWKEFKYRTETYRPAAMIELKLYIEVETKWFSELK